MRVFATYANIYVFLYLCKHYDGGRVNIPVVSCWLNILQSNNLKLIPAVFFSLSNKKPEKKIFKNLLYNQ